MYCDETVLAIPVPVLNTIASVKAKGVTRCASDIVGHITAASSFIARESAESDKTFKQLIPYLIVAWEDTMLLTYRLTAQSESRLHNKYSIGIGGHINPCDAANGKPVIDGLLREIHEELRISGSIEPEQLNFMGLLNDDTSEVGQVHLGFLYTLNVSPLRVEIREHDKMGGAWYAAGEVTEFRTRMETWSQMAFDVFVHSLGEGMN
jgi:predicted NUDIX family phosphoesterase